MMHGVKVLAVMSWSLLPFLRMAAAMHDGDDDDRFLRDAIINCKRETPDYGPARFPVYDGKAIRVGGDPAAHIKDLVQELIS